MLLTCALGSTFLLLEGDALKACHYPICFLWKTLNLSYGWPVSGSVSGSELTGWFISGWGLRPRLLLSLWDWDIVHLSFLKLKPWGSLPQHLSCLADLPNCSGFWTHVLEDSADPGCANFVRLVAVRKWMLWVSTASGASFWDNTKSRTRRPVSWLGAPREREHHLTLLYPQIHYPCSFNLRISLWQVLC